MRRAAVNVYDNLKVYKRGRTTSVTEGRLNGEMTLRIDNPHIQGAILTLKKCLQIERSNDGSIFFDGGDSGSGVFLLEEKTRRLNPLAIAFGMFEDSGTTLACPLENVLSTLNVSIQTSTVA